MAARKTMKCAIATAGVLAIMAGLATPANAADPDPTPGKIEICNYSSHHTYVGWPYRGTKTLTIEPNSGCYEGNAGGDGTWEHAQVTYQDGTVHAVIKVFGYHRDHGAIVHVRDYGQADVWNW